MPDARCVLIFHHWGLFVGFRTESISSLPNPLVIVSVLVSFFPGIFRD